MGTLLSHYQQFLELSKINPIMSGIIGVWLATVITWSFRNVPMRLWRLIVQSSLRHADIHSITHAGRNLNFELFLSWVSVHQKLLFHRVLQLLWQRDETTSLLDSIVVPGFGKHYFFYKKHLFWYYRTQMKQQATQGDSMREEIRITGLFTTDALMRELLEEFAFHPDPKREPYIWRQARDGHLAGHRQQPRPLHTVAVKQEILNDIIQRLTTFYASEAIYRDKGIAWKYSIELTGPSGTGKTSLVRALSQHFKRDVYVIDLSVYNGAAALQDRLLDISDGSFVLFEDYESEKCLWMREAYVKHLEAKGANPLDIKMATSETMSLTSRMTLSGFLNAIDGVVPLHNLVMFYTTNTPDVIDPAVRRKGRMDKSYELGLLDHTTIKTFIKGIFPKARLPQGQFEPISGANLSGLMLDNSDNLQQFVDAIPFVGYYDGMRPMGDMLDSLSITAHFDDATYHLDGSDAPLRVEPPLARGMQPSVLLVDESPFLPNAEMRAIELVNGKQLYPENGH